MHNIHHIDTIQSNNFITKVYSENSGLLLNIDKNLIIEAKSPREITDKLLAISGVNLIEVLDIEGNILLICSNILPENIDNYE